MEITELLKAWGNGDKSALNELMPLIDTELRRIARRVGVNKGLDTTEIINEAYIKLIGDKHLQQIDWKSRAHFFGLASKLIRNMLVDDYRNRMAQKRGGNLIKITLSRANAVSAPVEVDILELNDALLKFEEIDKEAANLIDYYWFGGLTYKEISLILNVSDETVRNRLIAALAWLRDRMKTK